MNCYEHTDSVAVASCACGRGLCGLCQGKRQPPSCDLCHAAAVKALIAKTQQRLVINCAFAVVYLIVGVQMLTGTKANDLVLLAALAWGFIGFRWLLDGLLGATRLSIFASGQSWLIAYFIGSLFCSLAGFVVVPVEIVLQWRLLKRLKVEAGSVAAPTAALGATS